MKKISYILLLLLLILPINLVDAKEINRCVRSKTNLYVRDELIRDDNYDDIISTPCVDDIDKVYDFADLLTDLEEEKLYQEVKTYIEKTGYDLALVTTNDNPKESAMAYADDFFDYNYFGKNETRDGVLILIDMENQELYLSTSGYAIKMYDNKIDTILDNGYQYVTISQYYDTFSHMITSLTNTYTIGFPESNEDLIILSNGEAYYIKHIPYFLVIGISSIITLVVGLVLYFMSRLKITPQSTVSYLKSKEIYVKKDNLVNTVVTHTLKSSSSSSGSSSRGGGSSFHSSSSGRSHGGGGRRF